MNHFDLIKTAMSRVNVSRLHVAHVFNDIAGVVVMLNLRYCMNASGSLYIADQTRIPQWSYVYRLTEQGEYMHNQQVWIEENNIDYGSTLRVTRRARSHENGWSAVWNPNMNQFVGQELFVRRMDRCSGIVMGDYHYPYFILEPAHEPPF